MKNMKGNDELYLNMGGKSFKNVSNFLKCNPGYGFGAVFTDVDNDRPRHLFSKRFWRK